MVKIVYAIALLTIAIVSTATICSVYGEKFKNLKKLSDEEIGEIITERDIVVMCGDEEDYSDNKGICNRLDRLLDEGIIKDDPTFEFD